MTKRKVVQPDLIDLLLADYKKPEDLIGENGILKQLTKAIVERALQAYPVKPVRAVQAGTPGSLGDTVKRLVFSRVGAVMEQHFVVDNRPAAGGSIGAEVVARAPADGYTLLSSVNSVMAVDPLVYQKLGYDPLRDFDAVSMLIKISEVLIAHPSLGTNRLPIWWRLQRLDRSRLLTRAAAMATSRA